MSGPVYAPAQLAPGQTVAPRGEPRVLVFRVSAQPAGASDGTPPDDDGRALPAMPDDFASWAPRIRLAAAHALAGAPALRGPIGLALRLGIPARGGHGRLHSGRPPLPLILDTVAAALLGVAFESLDQLARAGLERTRAGHGWIELSVSVHELRNPR